MPARMYSAAAWFAVLVIPAWTAAGAARDDAEKSRSAAILAGVRLAGSGACCFTDGRCQPGAGPADCGAGGIFLDGVACSASPCPCPPSFDPAVNFATGVTPHSVALADINGDSKPDLAVANFNGNNVSVLLGNGNGTFGPPTNFAAGNSPESVAIGDVNGDAKPDLAVANVGGANVSVLLGTGTGSFGPATNFGAGNGPFSVAIGDLNADAKPDLAVANVNSANLSVLLGNGDGTFAAATNFATAGFPQSVAIGDVNDDDKPDLAVANFSGSVSVLLGTGTGSFGPATNFGAGSGAFSLALGDVNGDGALDLAVANVNSDNVSVLLGNGDGTFIAATNYAVGDSPESVAIGDVDGDGRLDLAVANLGGGVSVLPGSGQGAFGAATTFGAGGVPRSVAIGDVNADGKPDLAVANLLSNNVSVLLGNRTCRGACCRFDGTCLAGVTSTECQASPGTFQGPSTVCSPNPCLHACCDANGNCTLTGENCLDTGAVVFIPESSVCSPNPCPLMCSMITRQPLSRSACVGARASFSVAATGTPTLQYQWRKGGTAIPGATSQRFVIAHARESDGGVYDCVVSNPCGSITSAQAGLSVCSAPPVLTLHPRARSVCAGALATLRVRATGDCIKTFQWRRNGVDIMGATLNYLTINPVRVSDAGTYDCVLSNACGSTTSNPAALSVCSARPVITLQPQSKSVCAGAAVTLRVRSPGDCDKTFQWRRNGVAIPGATSNQLTISPVGENDAATYDCVLSNSCGPTTSSPAVLSVCGAPPVIGLQPQSASVCVGDPFTLTVRSPGKCTKAFRWRKNGVAIAGATSNRLTFDTFQAGDAGTYDCAVSNACGAVVSLAAALTPATCPTGACALAGACTVTSQSACAGQWTAGMPCPGFVLPQRLPDCAGRSPPAIESSPANQRTCSPQSIVLRTTADDAEPATFGWRRNGTPLSDGPTGAGSMLSGSGTPTMTIAAARPADSGLYDCVVSSACGSSTSAPAAVNVCPADFDCSGGVTIQDVFNFLGAWFAHDAGADYNVNGHTTPQDIFEFLGAWFAGCG